MADQKGKDIVRVVLFQLDHLLYRLAVEEVSKLDTVIILTIHGIFMEEVHYENPEH